MLDCLGQRLLLLLANGLGRLFVGAGLTELRENHERVSWLDFWFHDFCSCRLMAAMTLPVCKCRCSPSPRGRTGQRRTWIPSNLKRGPCEDSPIPDSTDQPHPNCLRTTAASLQRTFRSRKDLKNQKHKARIPRGDPGFGVCCLPGTVGLRHLPSLPDVTCAQIPRITARWFKDVRAAKGDRRVNRYHLHGSWQPGAMRQSGT